MVKKEEGSRGVRKDSGAGWVLPELLLAPHDSWESPRITALFWSAGPYNEMIICQLTLYKSIDKICTFFLYVQTRIEKIENKTLSKNELFPWFSVESSEMKY